MSIVVTAPIKVFMIYALWWQLYSTITAAHKVICDVQGTRHILSEWAYV